MDITKRIEELKAELNKGNQALVEMAKKQDMLRGQLLRIAGAIQVLEEMKGEDNNGFKSLQSVSE